MTPSDPCGKKNCKCDCDELHEATPQPTPKLLARRGNFGECAFTQLEVTESLVGNLATIEVPLKPNQFTFFRRPITGRPVFEWLNLEGDLFTIGIDRQVNVAPPLFIAMELGNPDINIILPEANESSDGYISGTNFSRIAFKDAINIFTVPQMIPDLIDFNSLESINIDARIQYTSDGFTAHNWELGILYQFSPNLPSIDYNNRQLIDGGNNISVDWNNRLLQVNNNITLDWFNCKLWFHDGSSNILALDWQNRQAFDRTGAEVIDWHNLVLITGFQNALNWGTRDLINSSGSIVANWSGARLSSLSDPINPPDAANKGYVDAQSQGLDIKASVRVATTANITLSGTQTIDGVAVIAGNRVLVKDQTTASQNGIYVVAAGAWTRAADADSNAEVTSGLFTFATEGTVNGDYGFVLTTNDPIVLGTTALTFTQFSGAGQIIPGTGIAKSGNTISMANMAANTLKGNNSGSTGVPVDLTVSQVVSLLSVVPTSRTISTNAPLTGGGDLSANRTIAIPQATASVDGYLAATDFANIAFKNAASTIFTGNFGTTNTLIRNLIRTIPVTVGDAVDVGSWLLTFGAGNFEIWTTTANSGYSQNKRYFLPVGYDATANVWKTVLPIASTGPYGNNDFDLEIKVDTFTLSLRMRRTGTDTSSGLTSLTILHQGTIADTFTPSTAVNTVTAPTTFYKFTSIVQSAGNVGINFAVPVFTLDINGIVNCRGAGSYFRNVGTDPTVTFEVARWGGATAGFSGGNDRDTGIYQEFQGCSYNINGNGTVTVIKGGRNIFKKDGSWNMDVDASLGADHVINLLSGGSISATQSYTDSLIVKGKTGHIITRIPTTAPTLANNQMSWWVNSGVLTFVKKDGSGTTTSLALGTFA